MPYLLIEEFIFQIHKIIKFEIKVLLNVKSVDVLRLNSSFTYFKFGFSASAMLTPNIFEYVP